MDEAEYKAKQVALAERAKEVELALGHWCEACNQPYKDITYCARCHFSNIPTIPDVEAKARVVEDALHPQIHLAKTHSNTVHCAVTTGKVTRLISSVTCLTCLDLYNKNNGEQNNSWY